MVETLKHNMGDNKKDCYQKKLKVILIDPWGINNTSDYLNGLIYGLSKNVSLIVFTNTYFVLKTKSKCEIHNVFFRKSEKMKNSRIRQLVRGVEYIRTYYYIIQFIKKFHPDVVHVNWFLMYRVDAFFIKKIKRYCKKVIYTAHNVIPHINGEKSIPQLNKIYSNVDKIILHGASLKKEFKKYFPKISTKKIYIQKHGANLYPSTGFDIELIPESDRHLSNIYKLIFICFGNLFYNKGIDRLIKIWKRIGDDYLLIVAGKQQGEYPELEEECKILPRNIIIYREFLEDLVLNYYISISDAIVIPYREASMSGVIFTASDFCKTVIATDVGALSEYLNDEDSFICNNNDNDLEKCINMALNKTRAELDAMGKKLNQHINNECSWNKITSGITNDCYR